MKRLYAVGETSCNGVHGKNRLASNSLLESLVFAKRAARDIISNYSVLKQNNEVDVNAFDYDGYEQEYKNAVLTAIEEENKKDE